MCLKLVFDDPKYALVALGGSAFMAEKQMNVDIKNGRVRLWPLYEGNGGPYIFSKDDIGFTTKIRNKDQIIEQELLCVEGFTSKMVNFSWSCKLGYHLSKYPIHSHVPTWQAFLDYQKSYFLGAANLYEHITDRALNKFLMAMPVIFHGDDFMLSGKESVVVERFTIAKPKILSRGINTFFKIIFYEEYTMEEIKSMADVMMDAYEKFFKALEERLIVSDEK